MSATCLRRQCRDCCRCPPIRDRRALADALADLVHDETLEEVRREVDRIEEAEAEANAWCDASLIGDTSHPEHPDNSGPWALDEDRP